MGIDFDLISNQFKSDLSIHWFTDTLIIVLFFHFYHNVSNYIFLQRPEFDEIAIVGDKNGTGNGNTVTTGTSTTAETFRTGSTDLVTCPRIHSTKAISNAKIKTVKLTVVVVAGFLICSAPHTVFWLYMVFAGNHASNSCKY